MSEAHAPMTHVRGRARMLAAVVLAVLPGAGVPSTARAQSSPATRMRDALEQRIRANEDSAARIEARLAEFERAARADTRDTVRAGLLVLATSAELTAPARTALTAAWPSLRRQWGEAALARAYAGALIRVLAPPRPAPQGLASRIAPTSLTPGADASTNRDIPPVSLLGGATSAVPAPVVAVIRNGHVEHEQHLEIVGGDTTAAIGGYLAAVSAEMVQERADATLSRWLLRGRLAEPAPDYQAAFIDLVTAPALVNRQCAGGDASRCRQALGLAPVADPQATWYTDDDRRVIARAWWRSRQHQAVAGAPPENPCAPTPITPGCRAFMATLAPAVWTQPLGTEARMALLRVATELGGDGAFSRLVADTAESMDARLAAAAARPIDQVMLEWRARVMRAHPEPVRPRLALLLGCTLLCLAALVIVAIRQERA